MSARRAMEARGAPRTAKYGRVCTCSSNALFARWMNESIRPCHAAYSPAVSLRACHEGITP